MSEYYFTVKQNEILLHATAWINFESFMLSQRNPSKKKMKYYMIPLIRNVLTTQIYIENRLVFSKD